MTEEITPYHVERDKVKIAIERLQTFVPQEGYWLGFSGGKDSCVIKALCDMAQVKYDAHYSVTTIDSPEITNFIKKYHPDVIWDRPGKTFFQLVEKKGLPTRQKRWCCKLLKERGGEGRTTLLGIRAEESKERAGRKLIQRCFKNKEKILVHPILDWTLADVWRFIGKYNIPVVSLYEEGFKRVGCVMCPFSNQKKAVERFPKFVEAYKHATRKRWKYLQENVPQSRVLKQFGGPEEFFQWWLSGKSIKKFKEKKEQIIAMGIKQGDVPGIKVEEISGVNIR